LLSFSPENLGVLLLYYIIGGEMNNHYKIACALISNRPSALWKTEDNIYFTFDDSLLVKMGAIVESDTESHQRLPKQHREYITNTIKSFSQELNSHGISVQFVYKKQLQSIVKHNVLAISAYNNDQDTRLAKIAENPVFTSGSPFKGLLLNLHYITAAALSKYPNMMKRTIYHELGHLMGLDHPYPFEIMDAKNGYSVMENDARHLTCNHTMMVPIALCNSACWRASEKHDSAKINNQWSECEAGLNHETLRESDFIALFHQHQMTLNAINESNYNTTPCYLMSQVGQNSYDTSITLLTTIGLIFLTSLLFKLYSNTCNRSPDEEEQEDVIANSM
jgi:hypothetical protein